jgi:hypothetical protein
VSSNTAHPRNVAPPNRVVSAITWAVLGLATLFTVLASGNAMATIDLQTCGPHPPVTMRETFLAVGLVVYLLPAVAALRLLSREDAARAVIALMLAFASLGLPFFVFAVDVFAAAMC